MLLVSWEASVPTLPGEKMLLFPEVTPFLLAAALALNPTGVGVWGAERWGSHASRGPAGAPKQPPSCQATGRHAGCQVHLSENSILGISVFSYLFIYPILTVPCSHEAILQ